MANEKKEDITQSWRENRTKLIKMTKPRIRAPVYGRNFGFSYENSEYLKYNTNEIQAELFMVKKIQETIELMETLELITRGYNKYYPITLEQDGEEFKIVIDYKSATTIEMNTLFALWMKQTTENERKQKKKIKMDKAVQTIKENNHKVLIDEKKTKMINYDDVINENDLINLKELSESELKKLIESGYLDMIGDDITLLSNIDIEKLIKKKFGNHIGNIIMYFYREMNIETKESIK